MDRERYSPRGRRLCRADENQELGLISAPGCSDSLMLTAACPDERSIANPLVVGG